MRQLDLLTTPRARRSDPVTSHDAAESARELASRHQQEIMRALLVLGPLGKDGIAWASRGELTGTMVARRLSELERMGKVQPTGRTVISNSGRAEREWQAL